MPGRRLVIVSLAALIGQALACSRTREGGWPSRNYSGTYSVRAKAGSSSCPESGASERDSLIFRLVQTAQNEARMDIPPVISVSGRFDGDRLEAYGAVDAGAGSAAADSGRGPAADSIRYRLRLDFREREFEGTYRVEQPALGAFSKACSQEFEVRGTSVAPSGAPVASG